MPKKNYVKIAEKHVATLREQMKIMKKEKPQTAPKAFQNAFAELNKMIVSKNKEERAAANHDAETSPAFNEAHKVVMSLRDRYFSTHYENLAGRIGYGLARMGDTGRLKRVAMRHPDENIVTTAAEAISIVGEDIDDMRLSKQILIEIMGRTDREDMQIAGANIESCIDELTEKIKKENKKREKKGLIKI